MTLRERLLRWQLGPTLLILFLYLGVFFYQSFFFGETDYELVIVAAVKRLFAGGSLFNDDFVYPPASALLGWPAVGMTTLQTKCLVWLMNSIGASALTVAAWRFAGGRLKYLPNRTDWGVTALGVMVFFTFVLEVMVNRQTDLLIGGLLLLGLWAVPKSEWWAGVFIGLAASMKGPPLLFVPYLVWMGRWRAALMTIAVFLVANTVPELMQPPGRSEALLPTWINEQVVPLTQKTRDAGRWHAAVWANHSLAGWQLRVLNYDLVPGEKGYVEQAKPPLIDKQVARYSTYGMLLLLTALIAAASWRGGRTWDALGCGAVVCLMLLASPMSSKPHFCVLALPAWVLAWAGVQRKQWGCLAVVAVAGLLCLTSAKDLVGPTINVHAMWYGSVPGATLLLLLGCVWARWRVPS
jgi:Glycosyltransferase family 87